MSEFYTKPWFDRIRWMTVYNASDEVIPPFSVVWNDSDDSNWTSLDGDFVIPVLKGDNESSFSIAGGQLWMLTGPFEIAVGDYGIASVPTFDCYMLAAIDSGESSTYTENTVVGPKFESVNAASVAQTSWGVTINSSLPLWSAVSQVPLPDGSGMDPQKYIVGPLQNVVGNVLLDGELPLKTYNAASGSQTLLSLDPVPRTATYFVTFYCRVSIDTPNTLLLTTLLSNSTTYSPTIGQPSGRSTPNLSLSSGYETTPQQYPGSENIAMHGYAKVAKGDVIRLDFNASQSCNLVFSGVKLTAVPFGAPNLGGSIPS